MRRILIVALFAIATVAVNAQDVTKFMGIPVDGYKPEMKKALIDKGFIYDSLNDCFNGEFNGRNVNIFIVTNNNKVWRIMVSDKESSDETNIKIRFNNLCHQFEKNRKYTPSTLETGSFIIPDDENITHEMIIRKKRYEASYFQELDMTKIDTLAVQQQVVEELKRKFTEEELKSVDEKKREEINAYTKRLSLDIAFQLMANKTVWFMISDSGEYSKYKIIMFYDNEYNHANGEDL